MFTKVLIANRGEIAVRIARSVQAAGLQAIAIYSDPDRGAAHVGACDLAVALGGASAAESYLDIEKVLRCAQLSGAQAIHPGYGFLSENADFARACEAAGLVFIGPSPGAIELMGNKRAAKIAVAAAGVPCIPGYDGEDQDTAVLIEKAREIGLPVMVKATSGGGGRGMRLVQQWEELEEAIASARSEATRSFGNGELLLEQAITTGRHIEIQIAADAHGNVIHLGERDCSLQRRHQKVVEEAPSPFVNAQLRQAMGEAAVDAARSCDYRGVGTVEFLVAEDHSFSFLEMNTRLQVEHPVTELVTGVDLVAMQLAIAQGERLSLAQDEVTISGYAIEVRLYAEDPAQGFMPQTGPILCWEAPQGEGVRVDSGLNATDELSPFYDPMLAKVIASGATREQARQRLLRALRQTLLLGVRTNQEYLCRLLEDEVFVHGNATITYLDANPQLQESVALSAQDIALGAVGIMQALDPQPANLLNWSNAEPMTRRKTLRVNETICMVEITASGTAYTVKSDAGVTQVGCSGISTSKVSGESLLDADVDGLRQQIPLAFHAQQLFLQLNDRQLIVEDISYQPADAPGAASSGEIQASTEGLLIKLHVSEGDRVTQGQTLVVVEAMKMEHRHLADGDGVVAQVTATENTQVKKGQLLIQLELDEALDEAGGERA